MNPLKMFSLMACLALAGPLSSAAAQSAEWPSKPITWVVGWPPGGTADVITRLVASRLERKLGQPVVVENRPGASQNIALQRAAQAIPDGYTLVTVAAPIVSPQAKIAVGRELDGIADISRGAVVLVGPAAQAFPTVGQLLADVRSKPTAYSFGSSGNGTSQHLAGELLKQRAGIQMTHIPYKGGAQAMTDLLGGTIPLAILGVSTVLPHVMAGRLKAYAVFSAERSPLMPDVPTFQEAGIAGVETVQWIMVAAPRGMPADRVAVLNRQVSDIITSDNLVRDELAKQGLVPSAGSARAVTGFVANEQSRWMDFVRKEGLSLQ